MRITTDIFADSYVATRPAQPSWFMLGLTALVFLAFGFFGGEVNQARRANQEAEEAARIPLPAFTPVPSPTPGVEPVSNPDSSILI